MGLTVRARREDVDVAVRSASQAFPAWSKLDPNERARILWKAGELVMSKLEELARLEALDTGKPIANARLIDVPRTADTFFYFSGWATKLGGEKRQVVVLDAHCLEELRRAYCRQFV